MTVPATVFTWILVVFGWGFILIPMTYAQLLMILRPHGRNTKDLVIGKGADWQDKTHFHFSHGAGWADLTLWLPLLLAGSIGVILGRPWGYALWAASGAISVYINIILWFTEGALVRQNFGTVVYYTYYWGFFVYWGIAVVIFSVLRLSGMVI